MKRGKPLKRHKRLGADPEKVREFMRRARKPLERTELAPGDGMRRASPLEGPLTPAAWRQAVFDASDGRCIITGARARDAEDRRFDPHHPLAKRILRDRGLLGCVWDPRNGVLLRRDVHARHEDAFERVPAEKLPGSVWEFCAELDALEGTSWATDLVLRAHPATGNVALSIEEETDGEGHGHGR